MSERWKHLYSDATLNIQPSPIREMLHLIRQPGMISFAGGMPDPEIFPVEQFHDSARILLREGKDVMQYGTTEGYAPLREFLANWTAPRMGRTLEDDEILITSGSSQVVDLLNWTLINPGDCIISEEPTFLGSTLNMHNHKAEILGVPCDGEGMRMDALEETIRKAESQGKTIKYIYTIVNFHNPLGCTLPADRRRKLLEIANRHGLLVLEDDPYGYVRFDGEDPPSLFSLDTTGSVIFACSFSKILAPGTRVAWCAGDKDLIRKMCVFKQGVDVSTSVVTQALVYEYANSGQLDRFLPRIIDHYRVKRDAMEEAFRKHLPLEEVSWVTPEGGFFFWLETPNINARDLFNKAVEQKVAVVIGEPFYPNGGGEHNVRLCYTFAGPEEIDEGCKRLGTAMRELL
ncbi:MAG: PLP-dependent aminotransferase family protein [Synergistales bacterium]|nr:PLP-dependent aminotransferase family protein [Synergistales bacterium]